MESNFRQSGLKNLLKQIAFCKTNSHLSVDSHMTFAFKVLLSSLYVLARYNELIIFIQVFQMGCLKSVSFNMKLELKCPAHCSYQYPTLIKLNMWKQRCFVNTGSELSSYRYSGFMHQGEIAS